MTDGIKIERALLSCWDKEGLFDLATELVKQDVEIVSSSGTAGYLQEKKIRITPVEDVTGFGSILDGRVKTLHPYIHGAILAKRTAEHLRQLNIHKIKPIDLVVVNLYPFLNAIQDPNSKSSDVFEMIDIGGPAMLRAAAKNFQYVVALHQPKQYKEFIEMIKTTGAVVPREYSRKLAGEAFSYTAYYDSQISHYFENMVENSSIPVKLSLFFEKKKDLRYGENPHQAAAFYIPSYQDETEMNEPEQIWGKEMSYNNFVDVYAADAIVSDFKEPTVAIVKHTNPCGLSSRENLSEAFSAALACDPLSAFGGIIAANRAVDSDTAQKIKNSFYECIIAPDYIEDSLDILKMKKNLRILKRWTNSKNVLKTEFKYLPYGLLSQERDLLDLDEEKLKSVCKRKPTAVEEKDLFFAWKVVKHVKSNAIVFVKNKQLLGVGAGQMSRVDAVKLAGLKATIARHDLNRAVMASDAFFPFRDGIDEAASAGITAVIQPGGSVRDQEVIQAADEYKMAMLLTGIRHFKH